MVNKVIKRSIIGFGVFVVLLFSLLVIYYIYSRNNGYHFVEGTYVGRIEDDEGNEIHVELIITAIDKDVYSISDGINVVNDVSIKRKSDYYSLELSFYSSEHELIERANFKNLRRHKHSKSIWYYDDNNNMIKPTDRFVHFSYNGKSDDLYLKGKN